jgi:hypothetical protein
MYLRRKACGIIADLIGQGRAIEMVAPKGSAALLNGGEPNPVLQPYSG